MICRKVKSSNQLKLQHSPIGREMICRKVKKLIKSSQTSFLFFEYSL